VCLFLADAPSGEGHHFLLEAFQRADLKYDTVAYSIYHEGALSYSFLDWWVPAKLLEYHPHRMPMLRSARK
jgi:hypothetical protein